MDCSVEMASDPTWKIARRWRSRKVLNHYEREMDVTWAFWRRYGRFLSLEEAAGKGSKTWGKKQDENDER